jgi:hypothetical protein
MQKAPKTDAAMLTRRASLALLTAPFLLGSSVVRAAALPDASSAARLPPIDGVSLMGGTVHLPGALPAARSVVLVTQKREHAPMRLKWAQVLGGHARVPLLDLALFDDYGALFRDMVTDAMLKAIPDPVSRAGIVLVYGGRMALTRSLGIDDDRYVHVMTVERNSGTVLAHVWGEPTPQTVLAIQTALG